MVRELIVRADHGQIYIYSPQVVAAADAGGEPGNVYLDALEDATSSRRFVGAAGGLVDLMTPGQWNWRTPVRIEVWASEPPDSVADWDHEVDIDLDVPDGHLVFEASGGSGMVTTEIAAGRYRARVSGRGFAQAGAAGAAGDDSYRLQLWPRSENTLPALRKTWPG
jgi:hypothetical protein